MTSYKDCKNGGMKVIVIGAGLSGLECARLLVAKGCDVTVLEQLPSVGGCTQSYTRNGMVFDTGFHYVGGLDEGEHLWRLFHHLRLTGLPWHRLDDTGFDRVVIGDKEYRFASGHRQFAAQLADYFPTSSTALRDYVALLQQVGDSIFTATPLREQLMSTSAYDYLHHVFDDPLLIQVLSGTSLKMGLNPECLPLYTFAQINDSYLRGAYRLRGRGDQVARQLATDIERGGGQVHCATQVTRLLTSVAGVTAVEARNATGDTLRYERPDCVISAIDPNVTLAMLEGYSTIRPVYRRRLARMHYSTGMFTASLDLGADGIDYHNYNLFIHRAGDVWRRTGHDVQDVMVHFAVPTSGTRTHQVDLLAPMPWDVVAPWSLTPQGHRQADYLQLKQQWAQQTLAIADRHVPGLAKATVKTYTSTPLTYRRYTGVPYGAAFGIERDWHDGYNGIISPQSPVANLLFTGQHLMLHGVLGVTMTAFNTVSRLLGEDLLAQIE